jgi:septum formation protein
LTRLHLASSSARRADILSGLGLAYTAQGVDVDETRRADETPRAMVQRLASAKADAAAARHPKPILGADTAVVLGDRVFGKPASEADALRTLAQLSGRAHTVLTAVALLADDGLLSALSESVVHFRDISETEARAYWASGEPAGKAGSYAIQGRGGIFVESLAGSYSGVVGLPVFETAALLRQAGIDVLHVARDGSRT